MALLLFLILFSGWNIAANHMEIKEICDNLSCDSNSKVRVCGIRKEENAVRLKLFENECALLRYGCSVEDEMRDGTYSYGLIGMENCERLFVKDPDESSKLVIKENNEEKEQNDLTKPDLNNNSLIKQSDKEYEIDKCKNDCDNSVTDQVCGIKADGNGYRVRLFKNKCDLIKSNCATNDTFVQTDTFICENTFGETNNDYSGETAVHTKTDEDIDELKSSKSVIVVSGSLLGPTNNLNESIDNFFAATHVLDLPLKKMDAKQMETRRLLLKNVAAVKVFTPWVIIPKVIKTDFYHQPTLSSCYHKCPRKCPDTYAPVCGVPGIKAREPSIMFQNHCYMDVAQCKMFWENKSVTAISSSYIESSFLFCLGDQLNGLYRFLPLIRTLQHMGRLKRKGKFKYRLQNLRWFNNLAINEPKLMG